MKCLLTMFLMVLLFSGLTLVYAVAIEGDISVTDDVFSGKGEISSFDVNSEGNVLICVTAAYSYDRYVMIFEQDGTLLHTFEMRFPHRLHAMFTEDGNIVLYGARDTEATVFNAYGEILYEYSENYFQERSEAEGPSRRYYGDICYERNFFKSRITKCLNGEREVFYEIQSSMSAFLILWCSVMIFMVVSMKRIHRHRR